MFGVWHRVSRRWALMEVCRTHLKQDPFHTAVQGRWVPAGTARLTVMHRSMSGSGLTLMKSLRKLRSDPRCVLSRTLGDHSYTIPIFEMGHCVCVRREEVVRGNSYVVW